jgi:nitrogen regulatory protein PII
MKLLVIIAIKEFEKNVKQILKKSGVEIFSYRNVTGYKDITEESIENNWFASEMNENESVMFYAFVKEENVDIVFDLINNFNSNQKTQSNIHIAVLNIEKYNNK